MPSKVAEKKGKPKLLELGEEATVPEMAEAAYKYLAELFEGVSTEELRDKVAGLQRDFREVTEDLCLSQASLEDALARDFREIDEAGDPGADVQIRAKHYDKER